MKFTQLSVTNYRCFESETIRFEDGVNVVHGRNGSGKSTLLEATFFALYGTSGLRETDSQLEDILTKGTDQTEVELHFEIGGDAFSIFREVKERGSGVTQTTTELSTPTKKITGTTDVDEYIRQLLRMDAEGFSNSSYIRQGEINALIDASPAERQELIDKLLQLGKLETYKERASNIRVGVQRVKDRKENLLEDRVEEISKIEAQNPEQTLKAVESTIDSLSDDLDDHEEEVESLEDERESVKETVEEQQEFNERLTELDGEIESLREEIEAKEEKVESLQEKKEELSEAIQASQEKIASDIDEYGRPTTITADVDSEAVEAKERALSEAQNRVKKEKVALRTNLKSARERESRLESELENAKDEIETLREDIEEKTETIEEELLAERDELQEELTTLTEDIRTKEERLEGFEVPPDELEAHIKSLKEEREGLVSERNSISANFKAKKAELEQAQQLKEEGKCPECGQPVEGSPHVEKMDDLEDELVSLEEDQMDLDGEINDLESTITESEKMESLKEKVDSLKSEKETTETLIEKQENTIEDARETVSRYEQDIEDLQQEVEEKGESIEEAGEDIQRLEAKINEYEHQERVLEDQLSLLEAIASRKATIGEHRDEIEDITSTISHQRELIEEKDSRLSELVEERDSVEEQIDPEALEESQDKIDTLSTEIDEHERKISEIEEELNAKREQKGELTNTLDRLSDLRNESDELEEQVAALNALYEQMESVESMYEQLRGDLRQQNVARLEELLNDVFDIAYQNDSYDRIKLDGEYQATIIEKTATELEPAKLSGGESALYNLSLRAAIYQLLIEGLGDDSMMPPLILDEPTAHLDAGHVDQIDDLVDRMRAIGVEQTIVVSHSPEIIDSASHLIKVEQDGSTNRSSATAQTQTVV